ncbi:putative phosphoenolpyruvate carboxylase [Rosa chinensis]|uniref:Putative phosphoenolpyruvate carboxylase n=1 Tax=Rosa chinensis TaxID=74649 RepID=A0A2P6QIG2_ROSCH|nr:putative phosphoenolpyruvate carboxylase [Rosa chinensis]
MKVCSMGVCMDSNQDLLFCRKSSTGIGHLWAIPWVFAWTPTRFVLPAWVELNQV